VAAVPALVVLVPALAAVLVVAAALQEGWAALAPAGSR